MVKKQAAVQQAAGLKGLEQIKEIAFRPLNPLEKQPAHHPDIEKNTGLPRGAPTRKILPSIKSHRIRQSEESMSRASSLKHTRYLQTSNYTQHGKMSQMQFKDQLKHDGDYRQP